MKKGNHFLKILTNITAKTVASLVFFMNLTTLMGNWEFKDCKFKDDDFRPTDFPKSLLAQYIKVHTDMDIMLHPVTLLLYLRLKRINLIEQLLTFTYFLSRSYNPLCYKEAGQRWHNPIGALCQLFLVLNTCILVFIRNLVMSAWACCLALFFFSFVGSNWSTIHFTATHVNAVANATRSRSESLVSSFIFVSRVELIKP